MTTQEKMELIKEVSGEVDNLISFICDKLIVRQFTMIDGIKVTRMINDILFKINTKRAEGG